MMNPSLKRLHFLSVVVLIAMTACTALQPEPTSTLPPTPGAQALLQTSIAQVTQAAAETQQAMPPETATPWATPTNTPPPTVIATIARTSTPGASATPEGICNRAGAGVPFDITIPDGMGFLPGQPFTKTWRLVNTGVCKWTRLYKLVYYSQNPMGAMQEQFLLDEVLPGNAVDLSVNFVSPGTPGVYQGNWMLQDPEGNLFGLGTFGDVPFNVRIEVFKELTPTPTAQPTATASP